jgi:hypothetical protein
MITTKIPIDTASVKVMRSHDYCHFEVCLSTSLRDQLDAVGQVNALRIAAARLADKAVEQYKVAKRNAELALSDANKIEMLRYRHRDILTKPEGERTPEEMAIVKAVNDRAHHRRPIYDYEDEWDEPAWEDVDDDSNGF